MNEKTDISKIPSFQIDGEKTYLFYVKAKVRCKSCFSLEPDDNMKIVKNYILGEPCRICGEPRTQLVKALSCPIKINEAALKKHIESQPRTGNQTFENFFKILRGSEGLIHSLKYEQDCRSTVEAIVRFKGSFLEISNKIKKLVNELSPFVDDEFFGKWLTVTGSMNLHENKGYLDIEVGFRGIGISLE